MLPGGFGQLCESFTFQVHSVEVSVVGPPRIAVSDEIYPSSFFVHLNHPQHLEGPFRQPPQKGPIEAIEVEVIPPVPFGHPDEFLSVLKKSKTCWANPSLRYAWETGLLGFGENDSRGTAGGIGGH